MNVNFVIHDVITRVYGDAPTGRACAEDLASRLYKGTLYTGMRDRQHGIMLHVWNWFSGGTTAASVAEEIERKLADLDAIGSNL